MPIYEYVCQNCGQKFDKFVRSISAKIEPKCPTCGSLQADKALSAFSARQAGGASAVGSGYTAPACGPVG